ncbi:hypothetical protein OF117_07575 [Geodermatophilus sp. YIM 151500]|uniref:hypothetical protein n=1 Tax=Geodermatophilus sp. YIM 151500 TaxID=2984531 RepID=UPI0021E391DA|nr:hypothetical protein [Geodermatophilus sp. YIM 151500]MCV2489221.1 hypothetical protein [Geodermatophilus sp. YIM 151500]
MAILAGEVHINTPVSGSRAVVGAAIQVSGTAEPGENTVNGALLPPSAVVVSVNGGSLMQATMTAPDWLGWTAIVRASSPGFHVIRVTARRMGSSGYPVWQNSKTVTVEATLDRLSIVGVELTQGIQFCNINGQGSGFAPDNSLPLVARKSTIVRAYIERMGPAAPPTRASGELVVGSGPVKLLPLNGPIPAIPQTSINRHDVNGTLNFVLSPSQCQGSTSLTIRAFDPDAADPRHYEHERTFGLSFRQIPHLKVHLVGVHLTGPGTLNLAAPSDVAMEESLGDVSRFAPISGIDYSGYTVITFDQALTGGAPAAGGCSSGWDGLLDRLRVLRNASMTLDTYVGMVSDTVAVGPVVGCGATGLATARHRDISTIYHELGHALDRKHAPCGASGEGLIDSSFPTYDAFPQGSIGEVGFSARFTTTLAPSATFDVMSYCSPQWPSPYTWAGMMSKIGAVAGSGGGGGLGEARAELADVPGEYLCLNFRMHRNGAIEVLPSFHLYGPGPPVEPGTLAAVGCDLLGPDGRILASRRCRLEWNQSADDPDIDFHTWLPWDPAAEAIAFRREGQTMHTHHLEQAPPRVDIEAPRFVGRDPRLAEVQWVVDEPPGDALSILRFSHDDGATWRAVAANLTERRHVVNADLLPGGERCRFQIVASSGVRTAVAETAAFPLPVKPVRAYIHEPADGASITEGEPLTLRGIGLSPNFGTTAFEDMAWSSEEDGPLDVGYDIVLVGLPAGSHRFTLTVPDGVDGEAVAAVSVTVRRVVGGQPDV